jgi:hypothetical protein
MSHDTAPPPPGQGPGLDPRHPASTSSIFQLTMAQSTRSIGSTNVSSSSKANAPRPRIKPGWRRTISLGLPRRGTTPSSKTKACQPRVVSASSAPYVSGRRCAARGCRSLPGYRSSLQCTTTPSASTRCCAMHTTSRHPRRRSSLWEDCPTTYGSTSSSTNPRTCK